MPTSPASSRTETATSASASPRQLADLDQRIQRQLAAIEAGIDAVLIGDRIRALKAEHHNVEAAIAELDDDRRQRTGLDLDDACAVLDALPTSTTRSPPPTPSSAARSTTPSASASRSTATRPRYD